MPASTAPPITSDMVFNYLLSRTALASQQDLGHEDSTRNMDKECNYPSDPDADFFRRMYRRGDIAARVVDIMPLETWKEPVQLYETEDEDQETPWEEAWTALEKTHRLRHKMLRLDRLCGIGRYGVMMLGLPGSPDMPAPGYNAGTKEWSSTPPTGTQLLYTRVFDESQASILAYETDPENPRYGLPTVYGLLLVDHTTEGGDGSNSSEPYWQGGSHGAQAASTTLTVHWTRVIHLADNLLSSEVFGEPRMENVLNRLLDCRKVAGGSGEMFWKGGFPGYSFEVDPKNQDIELDKESLRTEFRAFSDGLQRYMATVGIKAHSLAPQVADPTAHLDGNIKLICITKGIPQRIFTGSEQGQLASGQDQKAWNGRVAGRQLDFAEPCIVRPLVDRLMNVGCLPPLTAEDDYTVAWPDLNTSTDTEKADILVKRVQALASYIGSSAQALVPPLEFLVEFMGLAPDRAMAVLDAALDQLKDENALGNQLGAPEPDATDTGTEEGTGTPAGGKQGGKGQGAAAGTETEAAA